MRSIRFSRITFAPRVTEMSMRTWKTYTVCPKTEDVVVLNTEDEVRQWLQDTPSSYDQNRSRNQRDAHGNIVPT